jgi:uncharacterized membrane protein YoaK (UPF0700 family)
VPGERRDDHQAGAAQVRLAATPALVTIVGVAAAVVPSRRAALLDPLVALRHE